MSKKPLLNAKALAAKKGLRLTTINRLRITRAIPHISLGYRSIFFDEDAVDSALQKREIREVGR